MTLPDLIGIFGVAIILGAYLLLQLDRLRQTGIAYAAFNAIGAALILVSLGFDFNLPATVIESLWLIISIYGIARHAGRS